MHPIIIITGPTASGKTDLSIHLARHFQAPVISADSRQCYRYLDIGTAKVSESILKEITHYYISCLNPDETTSVSDFAQHATRWIKDIQDQKKPVIIAGGSTLYLEALIRPMDNTPAKNEANIKELETLAEKHGMAYIRDLLKKADPDYLKRIDGPNPHRMFRALDVWMQTGKPFSQFHKNNPLTIPDHMLVFCMDHDRPLLHKRISERTDTMLRMGFLDEISSILDKGYDPGLQSLQTVGYREGIAFLRGKVTKQQMIEDIKTQTRRYARRQMTWFRRWNGVTYVKPGHELTKKVLKLADIRSEQLAAKS